jgi:hypothetical protein
MLKADTIKTVLITVVVTTLVLIIYNFIFSHDTSFVCHESYGLTFCS